MSVRSLYFDYRTYDFVMPEELSGVEVCHPVVVVGGGPVGLACALALVQRGIRVVVLHAGEGVGYGSRAAGTTRRSLEILHLMGRSAQFLEIGVTWQGLRSFYRDRLVLQRDYVETVPEQFPGFLNVQQCFTEQFLLDALLDHPLAQVRWQSRAVGVEQAGDHAQVAVQTPHGDYVAHAQWVVACDGAHSSVRDALSARYEGTSYEARYVIMDIKIDIDLPAYRYCWFDPPSFPGSTVLMHKQPKDLWRIDYQLRVDEDLDTELDEGRAKARVQQHLDWLGLDKPWETDCLSGYRAHAVSLPDYRLGHVLFAGDAAHLVPIFGIRGLNSGLEDIANLAWKLQYVLEGKAPEALLDTYTDERRYAALQNHARASKSAMFMSPDTPGAVAVRDAVLALAVDHPPFGELFDPRQSAPVALVGSPLAAPDDDLGSLGEVVPNLRLATAGSGEPGYLLDALGRDFSLLIKDEAADAVSASDAADLGVARIRIVAVGLDADGQVDVDGRADAIFGTGGHRYVLVRPDQHIAAGWRELTVEMLRIALARATGKDGAA